MLVTVDRVGRVVIPKPLRDALGIGPETQLEVTPDGAGLRLELVQRRDRSIETDDGLPILSRLPDVVLTDEAVRRLRDEINR
ncbi:MAG: AbrB/MazE/SpoVT family DNA-binding domain-containing protein [Acidimicrobiia bacterium]